MHAFLVYSPDNIALAENIATNLGKAGVGVTLDDRRLQNRKESDNVIRNSNNAPVLLLITDNFFKDRDVMYEAISFLKEPQLKHRVFLIVAEGHEVAEDGGIRMVPTKFERIRDLIQHNSYWGDLYLELRKRKRKKDYADEKTFNEHLDIVHRISYEINEFIRLLRNSEHTTFDSMHSSKYEALFRRMGWNEAHSVLKGKELVPYTFDPTATPQVNPQDIPGIDMLPGMGSPEANPATKEETSLNKASGHEHKNTEETSININIPAGDMEWPPDTNKNAHPEEDSNAETPPIPSEKPNDDLEMTATSDVVEQSDSLDVTEHTEPIIPEIDVSELGITQGKPSVEISEAEESNVEYEMENPPAEQRRIEEKTTLEKGTASYQNKSSYELLVSLFEEDPVPIASEQNPEEQAETTPETILAHPPVEEMEPADALENQAEVIVEEHSGNGEDNPPIEEDVPGEKEGCMLGNTNLPTIGDIPQAEENAGSDEPYFHQEMPEQEEIIHGREKEKTLVFEETLPGEGDDALEIEMPAAEETLEEASDPINKDYGEDADPDFGVTPFSLGAIIAMKDNGDTLQAAKMLRKVLERQPENTAARYEYALILSDQIKDYEEAKYQFNTLLEYDPSHIDSLLRMGELYELEEDYINAKYCYKRALNVEPDYPGLHYKYANLLNYHFNAQQKNAAKHYKIAAQLDPGHADAIYQRGILQAEHLGKPDKAIDKFLKVLELEPMHPFAHYDLAVIHHARGEREQAAKHYIAACRNNEEFKTDNNDIAFGIPENQGAVTEAFDLDNVQEPEGTPVTEQHPPLAIETDAPAETGEVDALFGTDTKGMALITGATSGIGRATARLFARHGHPLLITGRRAERLTALKEELETEYGVEVETLTFDVRSLSATRQAMDSLDERLKQVDILINNAGLARGLAPIHEGEFDHWETMIDTNIKGLLYMTRLVSPGMVSRGKGHIINIGSIAGKEAYANGNVYCATKSAVDSLTQSMRIDLHKYNIRVSGICPGAVEETEFSMVRHDFDRSRAKDYQSFTPLNAGDIAEIIYFVISRPPHVNIQDLLVMGTHQATAMIADHSGRKW